MQSQNEMLGVLMPNVVKAEIIPIEPDADNAVVGSKSLIREKSIYPSDCETAIALFCI